MKYSYNQTGACAADADCDTTGEVCKGDSTCGMYTYVLIQELFSSRIMQHRTNDYM